MRKTVRILGVDLASKTTGYAILCNGRLSKKTLGKIEIDSELSLENRLLLFRDIFRNFLNKNAIDFIVVESTPVHTNMKTTRLLAMFEAVVRMVLAESEYKDKYLIVSVNTIRSSLKLKSKEEVYDFIVKKFKLTDFKFKTHNDITDAIACCMHGSIILNG